MTILKMPQGFLSSAAFGGWTCLSKAGDRRCQRQKTKDRRQKTKDKRQKKKDKDKSHQLHLVDGSACQRPEISEVKLKVFSIKIK